jgi:hypothetical protein
MFVSTRLFSFLSGVVLPGHSRHLCRFTLGTSADSLSAGCRERPGKIDLFFSGIGVDTPEEVSARQFTKVHVRFVPEVVKDYSGKIITRPLVSNDLFWVELEAETGQETEG